MSNSRHYVQGPDGKRVEVTAAEIVTVQAEFRDVGRSPTRDRLLREGKPAIPWYLGDSTTVSSDVRPAA